ncbi:MAG TPA: hypothetical protein VGN42_09445 [Pirellulales bacterium]|nr:hypothetical protein [Pirellulales bacterium]
MTLVVGLWLAFFSTVRGEAVAFQAVTAVCLTAAFAGAGLFILGACMNVGDDWRRGAAQLGLILTGAALMALAGFSATLFWHAAYAG